MSAVGAITGALAACGVLALVTWAMAARRPSVLERISPALASAERMRGPVATLVALVPVPRASAGRRDLSERLAQAGLHVTPGQYRLEQLGWSVLGGALGACVGLAFVLDGSSPAAAALLVVLAGIGGYMASDRRLSARARTRMRLIDRQLPTAAELLAFAVGAGETPSAALARVAEVTSGDLAEELRTVADAQRAGVSLETSLRALSARVGTPAVGRFADGLCIALERGTPIAEVLRAQAGDARADQRRLLMEQAGRKDVLMLLPVVFLILPIVVVIAVYPGFTGLHVLVP